MSEHEVEINGMYAKSAGDSKIVVLKRKDAEVYMSIWVDNREALAILEELRGASGRRPMTHALLHQVLIQADAELQRMVINKLKDGIYYSVLEIKMGGKLISLDSRPSDALALATRASVPVFVTDKVLEEAGEEIPDLDEDSEEHEAEEKPSSSRVSEEELLEKLGGTRSSKQKFNFTLGNEERRKLEVFSKFIDSLDTPPKEAEEKHPPQ